ncbi:MAG: hypothetical protein ACLR8Y_13240 [Alistipes indistinctus]
MIRGIRNNNPGNIRKDKSSWRGEVAGPDKSFKTFGTMAWEYSCNLPPAQ